ncbi:MAG: N-acetylneuraminate synthase family protein [Nitrososphaera sp.]
MKLQADDGLSVVERAECANHIRALGLASCLTVRDLAHWGSEWDYLKVGSGECLNTSLIDAVISDGRPWIISTGGTTKAQCLDIADVAGKSKAQVIICECTSSYPSLPGEIRLGLLSSVLRTLEKLPGSPLKPGYSDHMPNYYMSLAAIALGVIYVEKHLSLEPLASGSNHASSIGAADMKALVTQGRYIRAAMANTEKDVLPREMSTGKLSEYRARYGS